MTPMIEIVLDIEDPSAEFSDAALDALANLLIDTSEMEVTRDADT
jgi:hypothetical protein